MAAGCKQHTQRWEVQPEMHLVPALRTAKASLPAKASHTQESEKKDLFLHSSAIKWL